jgi:hypothetical protein
MVQSIIVEQIPEIENLDQFCIKPSSFKHKARIHLKSTFIELWRDQMLQQTNGKLKTYTIVWIEPYQEVVLDSKNVLDVIMHLEEMEMFNLKSLIDASN